MKQVPSHFPVTCLLLELMGGVSKQMGSIRLGRSTALPRLLGRIWDMTWTISSACRICADHIEGDWCTACLIGNGRMPNGLGAGVICASLTQTQQ
jgi:hypothetical protein